MKMHAQPHRFKTWVKETPTVSRWVNKLWNIHMMDSGCFLSSFLRINKLQLDTGKWMTLINIILREKSQTLRSTYCTVWLHFYNYKPDQTNLWCLVRTLLHPWEWSQLCLKEDNKRVGGVLFYLWSRLWLHECSICKNPLSYTLKIVCCVLCFNKISLKVLYKILTKMSPA